MAKKIIKPKRRPSRETVDERTRRVEAQMLQRAVRQQQRIRDLSRKLITATAAADKALRAVGRIALEHDTLRQPELDLHMAAQGQ